MTETLVEDLERFQANHGLRPDLLFFTSDDAFGEIGTEPEETIRGQLERFADFLHAARRAFKPAIGVKKIFLVPGNHDVNRKRVAQADTFWLDEQKDMAPVLDVVKAGGLDWQRFAERLEDYRQFLEQQKLGHLLQDPERLIYATRRGVRGLCVGIAGFNTAWSCASTRSGAGCGWPASINRASCGRNSREPTSRSP